MLARNRTHSFIKAGLLTALVSHPLAMRAAPISDSSLAPIRSPRGTFKIVVVESPPGTVSSTTTVISNRDSHIKHRLPPQIIEDKLDTGHNTYIGEFHIAPNDRWILRTAKVAQGFGIACLYKKYGEADFRPVRGRRFDEAAWRFYATRVLRKPRPAPTFENEGGRLEFLSWTADSRHLLFRLRPIDGYTPAQNYGWMGFYDTRTGKFGSALPRKQSLPRGK